MKILLIKPPMYDQRKYGKPLILPYGPPLGIAYLASTLEKHGFVVKAIDMFDYSWEKVRQTLEEELPDVVGITCLTEQRASPLEVAKLSKTIKELMVCLEEKRDIGDIHGMAYKYQGKIIRTPHRQLIHNMDDIPFPAYNYFLSETQ